MKIKNILLTLCTSLLLTNVAAHAKEVKIGMAIDDLRLERWQKDRDIFVKKAESLGAKVFVQSANGNEETQMSQIENMINRGVDVLVIIPYNGQVLSNVVKEAKQEGIKGIAAGTQTMTVYKPITLLANTAAEIAVELGNGQEPKADTTLNNGLKDVPSRLLTPIDVNKNNIKDTVVKDGFHKESEL